MHREENYSGSYAPTLRGISFLVVGFFWAIVTGFVYVDCLSVMSRIAPASPGCIVPGLFVLLGIVFIGVGIALIVARPRVRPISSYTVPVPPPILPAVPLPGSYPSEEPKVPCPYCGSLVDAYASHCPACGAPMAAR
ncbi:MAG TPA: zinc ribbon domain-containing protein [Thermoplasmata archaeon]